MQARPLIHIVMGCCVLGIFLTDADAQVRRASDMRSNQELDLNQIFGRCGCDTCNGLSEHNNPVPEEDKDGANNFQIVNRWTVTAMSGGGLGQGDPTFITWSIIPDGTDANGGPGFVPSNMIAVFDNLFNEPNAGNPDLTTRFWHGLIEQALDRWSELSGIVYVYEPNDDGVTNFNAGGIVGVRGDVRIGGFNIDGGGGILAFNDFPNSGDMAVDTSDTGLFGNGSLNFRLFRNVYTHEQGHGIGFAHVESNNAAFLMEPFISGSFDGPQLDDVRAVHRQYGDVNERSNDFDGNNTIGNATDLGSLADGSTLTIGTDGATGTVVNGNDDDFVSVDDNGDTDYYRVNLADVAFLDVTLTPVGASYNQSAQGGGGGIPTNPTNSSNLTLALFTPTGGLIQLENSTGTGQPEVITGQIVPPGDTLIRVTGAANTIQLYTLSVAADFIEVPDSTPPTSVAVDPGTITSGDVSDVATSNDQSLEMLATVPDIEGDAPVAALFTFFTPNSTPELFTVTFEGAGNTVNLNQSTSIFNNDTNMFEEVDSREVSVSETSFTIDPDGDPQRFVQFPSGLVFVDIRYQPSGPVLFFPWAVSIDQLIVNTVD